MAIWVGGDKAAFDKYKPVLDAMGDRAAYIGPIGTATVAKLVHNMSGYAITCALAETFTMGVKAGMDPVALWEAVRQGVAGRRLTFDGLLDQFLPGKYDPPNFALKLATKDVKLATDWDANLACRCGCATSPMPRWGGVQPRLGRPRLPRRDAARARARRRQDRGRSGARETSGGTREVRLMQTRDNELPP